MTMRGCCEGPDLVVSRLPYGAQRLGRVDAPLDRTNE
jgi:hypothetical protein